MNVPNRTLSGGLAIRTVEYILHEWPISEEEYQAALTEVNPEQAEETVETIAQIYEKRYKSQLVERLLQRQFGPLSPTAQNRIGQASAEELDSWADRLVGASSLNAVFGSEDPH